MSDRRFPLPLPLSELQLQIQESKTAENFYLQWRTFFQNALQMSAATLAGSLLLVTTQIDAAGAQSGNGMPPTTGNDNPPTELVENSQLRLGVVRSPDNAAQWEAIDRRLKAAGLTYQIIELDSLQWAAEQSGITVLLLPNIKTWSVEQVLALESLMSQGVKTIATGPIGINSAEGVRHALASTLGGYWQGTLSEAIAMEPLFCRTELLCPSNWIPEGVGSRAIQGGILSPRGYQTEVMTTWGETPGHPAVMISDRTTFLGWEWGSAADVDYDSAWLRSAILRTETRPGQVANRVRVGETPTQTPEAPSSPQPSPAETEAQQLREAEAQRQREAEAQRQQELETASPATEPETPVEETPASIPQQAPATPPRPETLPVLPDGSAKPQSPTASQPDGEPLVDPAEQAAPAGLVVEKGPLPISSFEAIEMRQELERLLARVESALVSASAHDRLPQESAVATVALVSSESPNPPSDTDRSAIAGSQTAFLPTVRAIGDARTLLQEFQDLVQQEDYASARSKWLQVRDLLWEHYPTTGVLAQPEIRAIWLDRGSIVRAGSERGLAQIFDNLAAAGINTVFFETVNAGYPIYPSQVAPEQNPLTRNWDPLAAAVKLAHDRGMELHAWIWTFAAGNQRHNALLNLPSDYPGPVISAHPDWANYTNRGQMIPRGQTKPFLDPANPEVRSYLLRLIQEIATRYDVDGVQLDYIRYPFQDPSAERTYGYGTVARQEFAKLSGVDPMEISPSDRQLWQQWTDFRVGQIDRFVSEASQLLRNLRSEAILSVAVFPLNRHDRLHKIQQNWEEWARQGDVDLIVTMTYAMDTNRLEKLAVPWLEEADLGSALVLPAIRLLNLPEIVAVDQIQALRNQPAEGYALFAVDNLTESLQGIFQRTQGESDRTPIPYRQPFAAAAARFASLQREWNFLRDTEELWIREPQREEFEAKVAEVKEMLMQLATQPSPEHLTLARSSLGEFQSQLRSWMSLHSLKKPYQIDGWENRLESLEDLLRYGDRFVLQRSRDRD